MNSSSVSSQTTNRVKTKKSVSNKEKRREKQKVFEVMVKNDPIHYPKPFLCILKAERVFSNGTKSAQLYIPPITR